MPPHQIMPFTTELNAKLATRSRHVCVLLGAGASKACGLPDIDNLQKQVIKGLNDKEKTFFNCQTAKGRNLEQILSRLRRIAILLDDQTDTVDGLTAQQAKRLDEKACQLIVKELDINNNSISAMKHFAVWASRTNYQLPIEIFTVNYDLTLETALESLRVPYFDGFVGTLQASFHTELVEASPEDSSNWLPSFLLRVWKLHGSINWAWKDERKSTVVRLGNAVRDESPAAIYPSDAKYDESRRVPFIAFQDRFRRALHQPETLMIISGYSFGDEHINEIIFDIARRNQRSEFIAFCFSDIPASLAREAFRSPNLQAIGGHKAILRGELADWEASNDQEGLSQLWGARGFTLVDFTELAKYLAQYSPPEFNFKDRLQELLTKEINTDA